MAVRLKEFTYNGQSIVGDPFIETGTFQGETLENARIAGFKVLHSIEVFEPNFTAALQKFVDWPQVQLHLGSSPDVLPTIINPELTTTFWLDAHFQGGDVRECDPVYGECPLLAELEAIFAIQWAIMPLILIDCTHSRTFNDLVFC